MKPTTPPLSEHLRFWMEENIGKPPVWKFPPLNDSATLSFHRLHFKNQERVLQLFKDDPCPFVEKDFKNADDLYAYVANLWIVAPYSRKRGGIDWLIQNQKKEWVGLLHTYDLSKENYGHRQRHCTIGFSIGSAYRGTGIAQEAVQHLQTYLFKKMKMLYILAYTKNENKRSIRFLQQLGYENATLDYTARDMTYFRLYRSAKARSIIKKSDH